MKKYIPWIIGIVLVISLAVTIYLLLRPNDMVEEDVSVEELEQITPDNMKIEDITSSSFSVTWETEVESTGFVKYGNTSNSLSLIAQDANGTEPRIKHKIEISGLVSGRKYYFYVMSENVAFGRDGRALEVLTTSEL
jgi:hypothetical protein